MTIPAIDQSQQEAARVVGFAYLFAMGTAIFAEFHVHGRLIVSGQCGANRAEYHGAPATMAARAGQQSTDVALIAALYVILKRVNPNLPCLRGVAQAGGDLIIYRCNVQ